tara:strand:- start:1669 stop:4515 length:2847 start_codon:yes stop_codon:yes gene_type:complete
MKPTFLIIGVQKGGTTPCSFYLQQHPSVHMPNGEPHFFDNDDNYKKGIHWYEKTCFSTNKKTVGEKTPMYIFMHKSLDRIKEHYPHIKLIIVLRNPITRAYSQYNHIKDLSDPQSKDYNPRDRMYNKDYQSLNKIIKHDYKLKDYQQYSTVLQRGYYADQIEYVYKLFPKKNVKIIINEDLLESPLRTMNYVFSFLNIRKLSESDLKISDSIHKREYTDIMSKKDFELLHKLYAPHNKRFYKLFNRTVHTWEHTTYDYIKYKQLNNLYIAKLHTGWKYFDIYLSEFVDRKVNILEIGVYEGALSNWILTNVMTNTGSRLYAVDSFNKSNKTSTNFRKTFEDNIKQTTQKNQVTILDGIPHESLTKLVNDNKITFDVIVIDTSKTVKNMISNAILAWNMLNPSGILIFSNYDNPGMEIEDKDKPLTSINSFLDMFKRNIYVLYKRKQIIIRKKDISPLNKEIKLDVDSLTKEINELYNKAITKEISFDVPVHNNSLKYNLHINKLKSSTNHMINNTVKQELTGEQLDVINRNVINRPFILISSSIFDNAKNKRKIVLYRQNFIQNIDTQKDKYKYFLHHFSINFWNTCMVENLSILKSGYTSVRANNVTSNSNITCLNFTYSFDFSGFFREKNMVKLGHEYNKILNIYNRTFDANIKYYDISVTGSKFDNNTNLYMNEYIKYRDVLFNNLNLNNLDNMFDIIKDIPNKIDVINLSWLNTRSSTRENIVTRSTVPSFLYSITFCLLTQSKNGTATITHRLIDNNVSCQLLYILGKYYKTMKIHLLQCQSKQHNTYTINVGGFKGITEKERKELTELCREVDGKIKSAGQHVTVFDMKLREELDMKNEHTFNSIDLFLLKVLDNDIDKLKERLKEINKMRQKYSDQEYNLLARIENIFDEIKNNKQVRYHIEDLIFNKQIEYVLNWVDILSKQMNIQYSQDKEHHILFKNL